MTVRSSVWLLLGVGICVGSGCFGDPPEPLELSGTGEPPPVVTTTGDGTGELESSSGDEPSRAMPSDDSPACVLDGTCPRIDLLFVIDNSGTMGEEQLNLARSFHTLVDDLRSLTDASGAPMHPDVNIMVTTTDLGHPLCTSFQKPDYEPRRGAPVYSGCNSRIERFTGLETMEPTIVAEVCTENCPTDVAPGEHFINFGPMGSNVPEDAVGDALACIGPQGIDGCGYEAPLETMLQALNAEACWNHPAREECDEDPEWADVDRGFLREGSLLAIVVATDEMDCSVSGPDGYSYFTDSENPVYWNVEPEQALPMPSSAVCFNAGVTCSDSNADGIYEGCEANDDLGVLHPLERYTAYFEYLREQRGHEVVMLGIAGVPGVVAHDPRPPFAPIAGGVADLVHRKWIDFEYPAGDILPGEWAEGVRAAHKTFQFGEVGPGCTGIDDTGAFTGQAIPPMRLREVCESLDEEVAHCCIESICDTDLTPASKCLTGLITSVLGATQ